MGPFNGQEGHVLGSVGRLLMESPPPGTPEARPGPSGGLLIGMLLVLEVILVFLGVEIPSTGAPHPQEHDLISHLVAFYRPMPSSSSFFRSSSSSPSGVLFLPLLASHSSCQALPPPSSIMPPLPPHAKLFHLFI